MSVPLIEGIVESKGFMAFMKKIFGSTFFQKIFNLFFGTFIVEFTNLLFRGIANMSSQKAQSKLDISKGVFPELMKVMAERNDITAEAQAALTGLFNQVEPLTPAFDIIYPVVYSTEYLKQLTNITAGSLYQYYAKQYSPNPPPIDLVIAAYKANPSLEPQAKDALSRNGLSDNDISLILTSGSQPLDTNTIAQAMLQGNITQPEAITLLQASGLSENDASIYLNSIPNSPSLGELIALAINGSYDDTTATQLGLDDEKPTSWNQWIANLGLGNDFANYSWRSQWTVPPLYLFFQAINNNLIPTDMHDAYYRMAGIPPVMRPIIDQLSKVPLTVYQAQALLQAQLISSDKFNEICNQNGFNQNDTQLLLSLAQAQGTGSATSSAVQQVMYSYTDGFITEASAVSMLTTMGLSKEQADIQITLANYQAEYETDKVKLAAIEAEFKAGTIQGNDAVTQLINLGITTNKANSYIQLWTSQKRSSRNFVTTTQLSDMLKYKIITAQDYINGLVSLGYTTTDASRLLQLEIALGNA